jgi:hypothetical protein
MLSKYGSIKKMNAKHPTMLIPISITLDCRDKGSGNDTTITGITKVAKKKYRKTSPSDADTTNIRAM